MNAAEIRTLHSYKPEYFRDHAGAFGSFIEGVPADTWDEMTREIIVAISNFGEGSAYTSQHRSIWLWPQNNHEVYSQTGSLRTFGHVGRRTIDLIG